MTDQEIDVVTAMEKYGGSFIKALAKCFWQADDFNVKKLKEAFPEYWEDYTKKAGWGKTGDEKLDGKREQGKIKMRG